MRSDRILRAVAVLMAWMCLGAAAVFIFKIYDTEKQDRESADAYEAILEQAVRHGEPGDGPAPAVPEEAPAKGEGVFEHFEDIIHGSSEPEDDSGAQTEGKDGLDELLSELVRRPGRSDSTESGYQDDGLVADVPGARSQNDGTSTNPEADEYSVSGGADDTDQYTRQEGYSGGEADYEPVQEVDMDYLRSVNSDIVGWLYCPGTVINYPVVQGTDNTYYLSHLADGSENRNGCLFVDCDNSADLSDENTIIYGHHMQSGAMFASLVKYADQSYYEEHPYMYLDVGDDQYLVEVFAGYDAAVDDDAYCRTFACEEDFVEWLDQVKAKSDFSADVEVAVGDHIVTFSTCSYVFEDARYVVHGKLLLLS